MGSGELRNSPSRRAPRTAPYLNCTTFRLISKDPNSKSARKRYNNPLSGRMDFR
jgi:hypothetical protein